MTQSPRSHAVQRYCGLVPVGTFLLLSLIGVFVSAFFPSVPLELGCNRHNLSEGRIYALLTYAFVHDGLIHLVSVSCLLLLSVYFFGQMLSRNEIGVLIVGSILLGAVSFCLFRKESAALIGGA